MNELNQSGFVTPKENIIYEDHYIQVILALDPITIGHVVIVPIDQYKDIDELPPTTLQKMMAGAQAYVSLLKEIYRPKGYSIMQNGGDFNDTGQFHLHVFPRNNTEEFGWTYGSDIDEKQLDYKCQSGFLKPFFRKHFDHIMQS